MGRKRHEGRTRDAKGRFRSGGVTPSVERFWSWVKKGGECQCWEWQGACKKRGYGNFYDGARQTMPHRFSWELHNGPITDGLHVLHKCDNPKCVNPNHLFLGTQQDNMRDKKEKNRSPYAEQNHMAKFSSQIVQEIKNIGRSMPQSKICLKYGISQPQVSRILNNKIRQRG